MEEEYELIELQVGQESIIVFLTDPLPFMGLIGY
jgi:hypothetical protein